MATTFLLVLGNEKASKQVFNISGEKYITFDGLAKACVKAAGFPEPKLVHYNPKEFDFGFRLYVPIVFDNFNASIVVDGQTVLVFGTLLGHMFEDTRERVTTCYQDSREESREVVSEIRDVGRLN
ncbi:hypothetical protein Scep_001929 [Stephania cephalantha]|uniref:Uncharacterized protein n=1 Tax=Stephania cephalantha TaxID=152367 RepID=A0AAP0L934_9MAGN